MKLLSYSALAISILFGTSLHAGEAMDKLLEIKKPILKKVEFNIQADLGGAPDVGLSKEFILYFHERMYKSFNVSKAFKGTLINTTYYTTLDDNSLSLKLNEKDEYLGAGSIDVPLILYSNAFLEDDTYIDETIYIEEGTSNYSYDYYGDKLELNVKASNEVLPADILRVLPDILKDCALHRSYTSQIFTFSMPQNSCVQIHLIAKGLSDAGLTRAEIIELIKDITKKNIDETKERSLFRDIE